MRKTQRVAALVTKPISRWWHAAGYCIPPMVIWDRKQSSIELTKGEVPGTFYGLSQKGWMDQDLFDGWLSNHFLRYAPPTRPLLLLLDGHSSHYSPGTIRYAASEQVIVFTLPPHTTHLTQPLDRGCFSPLKMAWQEVCHTFMAENPGKRVARFNFSQLFCRAWMKSMTMNNILGGFRVTGIYPVNRNIIDVPKEPSKPSLPEATGLAYIPLYRMSTQVKAADFTLEELEKFESRFENGCDLKTDQRYNRWLQMYHPQEYPENDQSSFGEESISRVVMADHRQKGDWQKLLSVPHPPPKKPTLKEKQSGRVLTGSDFMQQMKEKEQKKKDEALKKEERKRAREEKAKERALMLERKAREREERSKVRKQGKASGLKRTVMEDTADFQAADDSNLVPELNEEIISSGPLQLTLFPIVTMNKDLAHFPLLITLSVHYV